MKVASVRSLLTLLEKSTDGQMFRGQTRDWPLLPRIGRYPEIVKGYDDWRGFHDHIIYRFLRLGHPYLAGLRTEGTDAWVLGQHHGLPTRLLDTTTNPLKALFFAVNDPADDASDGMLWIFSYTGWREVLVEEHRSFWDKELVPFLPAQLNPRLMAQEGSFISYPLPKNRKPLTPREGLDQEDVSLSKLIVPASAKSILRRELSVLGVQFRLLFPDLDGVARSIRLDELES